MEKEIKIVPPEGYEIDRELSTLECIKFKQIKKNLNILTVTSGDLRINNCQAATLFLTESEGHGTYYERGRKLSGHLSSMYLHDSDGMWYDGDGKIVRGYLFYKPRN